MALLLQFNLNSMYDDKAFDLQIGFANKVP